MRTHQMSSPTQDLVGFVRGHLRGRTLFTVHYIHQDYGSAPAPSSTATYRTPSSQLSQADSERRPICERACLFCALPISDAHHEIAFGHPDWREWPRNLVLGPDARFGAVFSQSPHLSPGLGRSTRAGSTARDSQDLTTLWLQTLENSTTKP